MSQEGQIPSGFSEWVVRSLDGTISEEQFARLDREITTNASARTYYLELIAAHVGLVDFVGALPKAPIVDAPGGSVKAEGLGDSFIASGEDHRQAAHGDPQRGIMRWGPLDAATRRMGPGTSEEDRIREIERYARQQLAAFLAQEQQDRPGCQIAPAPWDFWAAIEAVGSAGRRLAAAGAKLVKTAAVCLIVLGALSIVGLAIYAHRTLGVLVDSSNAKWGVPLEPTGEFRAGRMTLEEGYARIRLKKGAEVILQAPSTFDLRTTNRMFLESGWITALVPPSAAGFTVKAPASSVVDFGTEFGLMVGQANNTEVHVFDGRIEFDHSSLDDPVVTRQRLTKNEAVTVDADGRTSRVPLHERPHLFSRAMPSAGGFGIPGRRLNLADIVGAGNGLDTGIWGQGVDAATGQISPRRRVLKRNDNGFAAVPSLPFIDGVFVPDSNDGSAIVTSTGIEFAQCPRTCGRSYEVILNGAIFEVGASGGAHYGRLAGQTYDTRAHPSIGMHPNAGITFDLEAIRNAMPEAQIDRFRARCGVAENVVPFAERDADPNTIEVTFWVLVDGQPRFSTRLGVVPAQSEPIDVPIGRRARFLTLATTNPGEYRYCWAMFAEPALELVRAKVP